MSISLVLHPVLFLLTCASSDAIYRVWVTLLSRVSTPPTCSLALTEKGEYALSTATVCAIVPCTHRRVLKED